jgi:hypothetical protein
LEALEIIQKIESELAELKVICGAKKPEPVKTLANIVEDIQQGAYNGKVTTDQGVEMIKQHFKQV